MGGQTKDRAKTTPAVMCVKILLHIFNLIYLIIGACVLGLGIWIQVQLKDYIELTELYYANSAWIMVGVGVLIVLVALGGFCCTAKDKVALLYMYGIFITLIAVLQIAAGIAGAVMSKKLNTELEKGLTDSIKKYPQNEKAWDAVQKLLGCCGVNDPSDWKTTVNLTVLPDSCRDPNFASTSASPGQNTTTQSSTPVSSPTSQTTTTVATTKASPAENTSTPVNPNTTTTPATVPTSTPKSPQSSAAPTNPPTTTPGSAAPTGNPNPSQSGRKRRAATVDKNGYYDKGCHTKLVDKVSSYLSIIVGVCVGFVLLQIIGAVLACCLAKMTKKNNYEQIY